MSNIYIQEPPTAGKILLETTAGDIDIELWSKETPKACRNFIQLCMEGYYDNTIFHRLVKDFIVQGGCPRGDGTGGNSIWGKPFKDEIHSRLRFTRRGLVAMANAGRDDNGSQFFFTLGPTPELQSKHTIFGKVGGNTIYNMIKLGEGETDADERPAYPYKVLRAKILNNPFDDIIPRESIKKEKSKKEKNTAVATKNYKLLSFGEEAEEDEGEVREIVKGYTKGKSSHDLANDPKLSSQAIDIGVSKKHHKHNSDSDSHSEGEQKEMQHADEKANVEISLESVRSKLKKTESKKSKVKPSATTTAATGDSDGEEYYLGKDEEIEKNRKLEAIKKQVKDLRREMKQSSKPAFQNEISTATAEDGSKTKLAVENSMVKDFFDTQKEYKEKAVRSKGSEREAATLAMLAKFQDKVRSATQTFGELEPLDPSKTAEEDGVADEDFSDTSWLARKLVYEKNDPVLAKDASTKADDWFEITDPRNPLTKRRREHKEKERKSKKHSKK